MCSESKCEFRRGQRQKEAMPVCYFCCIRISLTDPRVGELQLVILAKYGLEHNVRLHLTCVPVKINSPHPHAPEYKNI